MLILLHIVDCIIEPRRSWQNITHFLLYIYIPIYSQHISKTSFSFSDYEARELVINLAQGPPREEISNSPQSPIQTPIHTPTRPMTSHQKYQSSHTSRLPATIVSPQSTITDSCSDSNSALTYQPPEYPVFLPAYNNEDPYYPPQEIFYQYSDSELSQHQVMSAPQQRPYSTSSSSCSSSESEHLLHNVHTSAYSNSAEPHNFTVNCFNNNQSQGLAEQHWQTVDFIKHNSGHQTHSAGYTSVIVDTQQYQLANEYVH